MQCIKDCINTPNKNLNYVFYTPEDIKDQKPLKKLRGSLIQYFRKNRKLFRKLLK